MNKHLMASRVQLGSRNSIFSGLAAVAIAVLVGSVAVVSSLAANQQLYLSPATASVLAGNTIAVQIRVNSGAEAVNAVQANLSYDPTQLEYLGTDAAGSAFSLSAASTISSGGVKLARAISGGAAPATGDNLFATVTFKALAGSGIAAVAIAADSHVVRSADNADILTVSGGASYTLTSLVAQTPAPTPAPAVTPRPTQPATPASTPTPAPTRTPVQAAAPSNAPAAPSGTLFITPAAPSVPSGSNFTLDIRENSGTVGVNAAQANLSFDPLKLQYMGMDDAAADFGLSAITAAGNGTLAITRAVPGGYPALTGDKLVARVIFKANAGSGSAKVDFAAGSALATSLNTDALKQITGAVVQIQPATVGGGGVAATASPAPVVVTPVVGAKKPIVVWGTAKLTTPAISTDQAVFYEIDDTAVESDAVDTTALENGVHIVTATTTDTSGKTEEVKQRIEVKNEVPLWKQLVAGVKENLPFIGLGLVLVMLLFSASLLVRKVLGGTEVATTEAVRTNLYSPEQAATDEVFRKSGL